MITQEKIQEIADKIVLEFNPEKVILFGSYAWGTPNQDSDVDLFIIKETENTRETTRVISRKIFPRPFPMDLIVYTPLQVERRQQIKDLFVNDILSNGKILYAK